jgi:tRNA (guanine-N7-)-methyltransferase
VHPDQERPDWGALLRPGRPLHCEIGFGHGHFALDYAAGHDVSFVAIEMRRSDCDLVRERRDRRDVRNLEVIQGDARLYLPRFFAPGSVDCFHIHCPDPWWKKRHHRRRLIADDFALELWHLLRPGGTLDLRTDVPAYAQVMMETCEELIGYENVYGPGVEQPTEGLVLSTRERRYRETGQPVYRYLYRRPPGREPRTDTIDGADQRREWVDVRRK